MSGTGTSTHLVKLYHEDDKFSVAKAEWIDGDIHLTILGEEQAFSVSIEKDTLKEMGEKLRLKEIDEWAEEAFKQSSRNFVFSFSVSDDQLIWRRRATKVKIKIGTFDVQKISHADAQNEVFSSALSKIDESEAKIEESDKEIKDLKESLRESRAKCAEFGREKSELEAKMLEQFLPLLQSKKDKIRELERRNKSGKGGASQLSTQSQSQTQDDYGSGTDVDEEDGETPSKKMKKNEEASKDDSQNFLNIWLTFVCVTYKD